MSGKFIKFGLQICENGTFGLIAQDRQQMRMLAEIASISSDRISSFGPVTADDSLTQIVYIESRKDAKAFDRKVAALKKRFKSKRTERPTP